MVYLSKLKCNFTILNIGMFMGNKDKNRPTSSGQTKPEKSIVTNNNTNKTRSKDIRKPKNNQTSKNKK
jgi:hypothetical protein